MDDCDELDVSRIPNEFMQAINEEIRKNSSETAVTFLQLPEPPKDDNQIRRFYDLLAIQSDDLQPIMYVHGVHSVVCTSL